MLVLRRREPNAERKFRAPAATLVGIFGILGCIYLFISLPNRTQIFFFTAQAIGIVLYFIYGGRAAERARCQAEALADPAMAPATEVTKANGPGKLLLPVLVGVLLIPAALGSSQTIFNDGDVSWHIATGQWILDHRAIPHDRPLLLHLGGQALGADRMAGGGDLREPPIGLPAIAGVAALVTAALMALHAIVYLNASRWIRSLAAADRRDGLRADPDAACAAACADLAAAGACGSG